MRCENSTLEKSRYEEEEQQEQQEGCEERAILLSLVGIGFY